MSSKRMNTKLSGLNFSENTITNFESNWDPVYIVSTITEWISNLKHDNQKNISDIKSTSFIPQSISAVVFSWCEELKLNLNVFLRTLELFDRFTAIYFYKYRQTSQPELSQLSPFPSASSCQQQSIMKLTKQSLLHLMSCFQIASKLEDAYKVITVKQAAILLAEIVRPFSTASILHSEVEVLSTLQYKVNLPPITDFVDLFTCELVHLLRQERSKDSSRNLLSNIDNIRCSSFLLIQLICLDTFDVNSRIVDALYGEYQNCDSRKRLERIREIHDNKLLLACGAISAATFLYKPNLAAHVMKHLYPVSGIHPTSIAVVSSVIVTYKLQMDQRLGIQHRTHAIFNT